MFFIFRMGRVCEKLEHHWGICQQLYLDAFSFLPARYLIGRKRENVFLYFVFI